MAPMLLSLCLLGWFDGPAQKTIIHLTPALTVDRAMGLAYVDAEVAFREGPLELVLCPRQTKEHESILSATIEPKAFQTALLLAGAIPGEPARFEPRFRPPVGQRIKIWVEETRADGQTSLTDIRLWVRDVKSRRPVAADFVFAGSRLVKAPGVERPIFLADDGDVICVANFPGAIIDVAMRAPKENQELLFEAWTDRIPERGSKVRLILEPILEDDFPPPSVVAPAAPKQSP